MMPMRIDVSRPLPGFAHPAAKASDQTQGPRRPALAIAAKDVENAGLDRIDQRSRLGTQAKYHHYEIASAAFQIGIVLASATIITGIIALAWISGLLALTGIFFTVIGLWAPHAVHLM